MSGFGLNECIYYFTLIHPVYYHIYSAFKYIFLQLIQFTRLGAILLMTYKHIRNENNANNLTKLPAKSFLKIH